MTRQMIAERIIFSSLRRIAIKKHLGEVFFSVKVFSSSVIFCMALFQWIGIYSIVASPIVNGKMTKPAIFTKLVEERYEMCNVGYN